MIPNDNEQRFRAIFENAAIGIAVADSNGRLLMTNRALEDMLGYAPGELHGKAFTEVTHSEDIEKNWELFLELAAGKRTSYKMEKRYLRKNGEIVHAHLTVSNFPNPGGDGRLTLGMVEDITERKAMQEALLRNERLSTLGKLTAMVAHDLRNPLFAIRQFALTLRKGGIREAGELARIADGIEQCVVECHDIIEELLDFSRTAQLERRPVAVERLIRDTINGQRPPATIALHTDLRLETACAVIDPRHFRRALQNVIDNAIHATLSPASAARTAHEPRVEIAAQATAGRIEIDVSDNGHGIGRETLPRIFEPLFSTRPGGYGLGLAIVKKIMEEHGGGVDIRSTPGCGTTVRLWLPRAGHGPGESHRTLNESRPSSPA